MYSSVHMCTASAIHNVCTCTQTIKILSQETSNAISLYYIHTCIYACMQTCRQLSGRTFHAYIHIYIHTYIHTYIHVLSTAISLHFMHTYIHTYTTCIQVALRTYFSDACNLTIMLSCAVLTYIHTCIPTYLHVDVRK